MLNSVEHEILNAHKYKNIKKVSFLLGSDKPTMLVFPLYTCSQNRQSTKFQNHENINFVEKLYFFVLYNQVYIAKHDVKPLHSGFIFRENTSHYKVGG